MIQVLDYGFGNVRSMVHAFSHLGLEVVLSADRDMAMQADGLVIPGVGAFGACMSGLSSIGGDQIIRDRVSRGLPVLGVCVGLQIMFQSGNEEGQVEPGLGLIPGQVSRLDAPVVPHMGWDQVQAPAGSKLMEGIGDQRFYFVHSYAAFPDPDGDGEADVLPQLHMTHHGREMKEEPMITWSQYGHSRFVAAYECGPLSATQFHPEKSAQAGARLLTNWVHTLPGQPEKLKVR